jgi:hypothetical protein
MLFGERVAVYCKNHTEHIDTVRTSQKTHYVSATETNRLMLFGERVAVYCKSHTEHIDTVSYLTGNTLRLRYRDQPVNAVWGNSRFLLWEPFGAHRYTVWTDSRVVGCKRVAYDYYCDFNPLMFLCTFLIIHTGKKGESYPCNRPWRLIGLWHVEAPIFCRHTVQRWRWGCRGYITAALYSLETIPGTHFC